MASICGLNISASNLAGTLTTQLSGFLELSGTLGKISGITSLGGILGGGLDSIKGMVTNMLPEIPKFEANFSSLGDELGGIIGSVGDFTSGIGGFLSKYAGLKDFSGFANFDLNNLANSAFSLGANFDPCSIDIPKIFSDADGALTQGAQSPSIGATEAGGIANLITQEVTDAVAEISSADLSILPELGEFGLTNLGDIKNILNGVPALGNIPAIPPSFNPEGILRQATNGATEWFTQNESVLSDMKKALGTITTPGILIDEETQNYTPTSTFV